MIALTDVSSAIAERYAYSAYGEPVFTNASGTVLTESAKDNRYTYTGREWDEELSLYHFRARIYDVESGRFLGRDPVRFEGGFSLYQFLKGLPVLLMDPFGLTAQDPELPPPLPPGGGGLLPGPPQGGPGQLNCSVRVRPGFPRPPIPDLGFPLPESGCYDVAISRSKYEFQSLLYLVPVSPSGCDGVSEEEVKLAAKLIFETGELSFGCVAFRNCEDGCECETVFEIPYRETRSFGFMPVPILGIFGARPCIGIALVSFQQTSRVKIGTCACNGDDCE